MTFAAMRHSLQRRGLLDDRYQLTDAGRAYADALLVDLADRRASPCPLGKPRVRWNRSRSRLDGAVK